MLLNLIKNLRGQKTAPMYKTKLAWAFRGCLVEVEGHKAFFLAIPQKEFSCCFYVYTYCFYHFFGYTTNQQPKPLDRAKYDHEDILAIFWFSIFELPQ